MKVAFTDFWPKFRADNNFFLHALRSVYEDVEVSRPEECDVLFFSVFGLEHKKHSGCLKVAYTGENVGSQTLLAFADRSLSFEPDSPSNWRLPLWYLYIDWFGVGTYNDPKFLVPLDWLTERPFGPRRKFCASVFSNPVFNRLNAVQALRWHDKVDVYGKRGGMRLDGAELEKIQMLGGYRFSICFENSKGNGYVTEKFLHARVSGTIPIYYGDDMVSQDFDTRLSVMFDGDYQKMFEQVVDLDSRYNSLEIPPAFNSTPSVDPALRVIMEATS